MLNCFRELMRTAHSRGNTLFNREITSKIAETSVIEISDKNNLFAEIAPNTVSLSENNKQCKFITLLQWGALWTFTNVYLISRTFREIIK